MSIAETAAPRTWPPGKKPPRNMSCQRCSTRVASSPTIRCLSVSTAPAIAGNWPVPASPTPRRPSSLSTTTTSMLRLSVESVIGRTSRMVGMSRALPLDARDDDTLDEVALREEEDDQDRDDRDGRHGHHRAELGRVP